MLCSNCGFELEDGDKFCYICGKPVVISVPTTDTKDSATSTEIIDTEKQPSDVIKEHTDAKLLCPVCGFELEAGDQFCYKCGTPVVEETKAVAESDVEAVKAIEDIADVSDNAKAEGEQIVAEALAEGKPTSQDTGDGTIDTEQAVHEDPSDEYICCKCGLVLSRDDKFCYKCGTPVVIEGTTETEPVSESVDVSSNEEQTKVVDAGTDEQLIEKENNSTDYEQFKENAIDDSPVKAEENNEAFSVPGIVQEQKKSAVAEPVKEQVSEEPTGGVFCSNCGFKLNADDKFCYKCGRSVTTNTEHETNKVEVIQSDKDETGKLQKDQTKANSRLSKTEITEAVVGIGVVAILVIALVLACIFFPEHNKNNEVIRAANTFAQALVKQDAGKIIKLTDEKKDSETSQYIVNLLDTTKYSDDKNAFIKAVGETMTFEIDESTLTVDKDKASVKVVFTMVDYAKVLENNEYYDIDDMIDDLTECDDTKEIKVKFEFEKKGDDWTISNLKSKNYKKLFEFYDYEINMLPTTTYEDVEPTDSAYEEGTTYQTTEYESTEDDYLADQMSFGTGSEVINLWSFTNEVPNMIGKYIELHPEFGEKYTVKVTIIATTDGAYQPALDAALAAGGEDAPDIYTAEAAFILKYTQGDMASYAATYKDLGIDVDAEIEAADIAQYTVDIGSRDGEVVALGYQATGGMMIYRRSIAIEVFGTDDPYVISEIIGSGSGNLDMFYSAASTLADNGYAIVSGDGDVWHMIECYNAAWVNDGALNLDTGKLSLLDVSYDLTANGWSNSTIDWTEGWYADIQGVGEKPVFCFFGPAWLVTYIMAPNCGGEAIGEGTYGDWAVCAPPMGFFWGGTWILANKDTQQKEGVAELIEWITLDCTENGLQYAWANGTFNGEGGTKECVASGTVMAMSDGTLDFLGGQDMFSACIAGNNLASGVNGTQWDVTINDFFRDSVRQYALPWGDYYGDKDGAIGMFISYVNDNLVF